MENLCKISKIHDIFNCESSGSYSEVVELGCHILNGMLEITDQEKPIINIVMEHGYNFESFGRVYLKLFGKDSYSVAVKRTRFMTIRDKRILKMIESNQYHPVILTSDFILCGYDLFCKYWDEYIDIIRDKHGLHGWHINVLNDNYESENYVPFQYLPKLR